MAAKTRTLTAGEVALLREPFGDRVDYARVRLQDGPGANLLAMIAFRQECNWAMTYLNTIHYNKGHFRDDFSTGDDKHKALLVHEITHVWQYAKMGLLHFGLRYGWNLFACDFGQGKTYDYSQAGHFADATLEGQAQMVSNYYGLRNSTGTDAAALKNKLARTGFYKL